MRWIERDGIGLRYEYRPGEGPVLVLVHEMGGSLESFDEVVPRLPAGLPWLRFDGRGAGLSSKLRGTVGLADLAADIDVVLDAAGVSGDVALAGIAVGGAVALHRAARGPDRVRAVLAFGPATGLGPDRRPATLARAEAVEAGGMAAIAEAALSQSYPEALRDGSGRFERLRARWLGNDPGSYAAILRMLAALDMTADLAAIRCPVSILCGEHDLVRPAATVRPVADQVPGARFRTIASGHFASVQAPELFAAELGAFMREIAP